MSRTRVIYLIIFATFFLILLAIVVYYLIYSRIFADSTSGLEISRQSKNWDVDSDDHKEAVSLAKYQNGSKNTFRLIVAKDNGKNYSLELTGFESEVGFCKDNELIPIEQFKIICLSGYVGVHSQNIQLLLFDGTNLKPIQFKNSESSENRITSDVPNFAFTDLNNDNLNELYIDNRDYEKDPVLDILRSYYYFIDGVFRYNNVESIHINEQTGGYIN